MAKWFLSFRCLKHPIVTVGNAFEYIAFKLVTPRLHRLLRDCRHPLLVDSKQPGESPRHIDRSRFDRGRGIEHDACVLHRVGGGRLIC